MTDDLVVVSNLSKKLCRNLKYSLLYGVTDLAAHLCAKPLSNKLRDKEFWALKEISLTVKAGQTTALIGRNGAGKTTLLRVIAGLIKPNGGEVSVRGRVVPLIALGAGFSPSISSKENCETFLALLGVSKSEARHVLPEIFSFAELTDKENDPISSFSSGMVARLAFACAVFSKPDILLIDEVLAVGDLSFHLRCYEKLAELKNKGTALVMVSHNLTSVLTLADTVAYLENGQLKQIGDPPEVCARYEEDLRLQVEQKVSVDPSKRFNKECTIRSFSAVDLSGRDLKTGYPGRFFVRFDSNCTERELVITVLIKQPDKSSGYLMFLSSEDSVSAPTKYFAENLVAIDLPFCGFVPGLYLAKVTVFDKNSREILAIQDWVSFKVADGKMINQSLFFQPHNWSVTNEDVQCDSKEHRSTV